MLSPECRQGDKERDLLITMLISSDGDKQMQEGKKGLARGIVFLSLVLGEGKASGPLGGFYLLPAHGNVA